MSLKRILGLLRTPPGRAGSLIVSLCLVAGLFIHSGFRQISEVLFHSLRLLPWILLLEGGILACTICALRKLYGPYRRQIPGSAWVRTGLMSYSVMGLMPAGRAMAETARATLLGRYVPLSRAAAAAIQLQGVALLANATVSIPATIALYARLGPSLPVLLIALNMVLTGVGGTCILLGGRRAIFGKWLGRAVPRAARFGQEFDQHLSQDQGALPKALAWEACGRLLQVVQNGLLVCAVGGAFRLHSALCSEGLHLIGAAAGDLLPAQLGATELSFQLSSRALALPASDALSIAVIAHAVQLTWIGFGVLAPVVLQSSLIPCRASPVPGDAG